MENKETKINELKRYSYIEGCLIAQRNNLMWSENYNDEEYNDLTDRLNKVSKHCKDVKQELTRDYGLTFEEIQEIEIKESNKGSKSCKR